MTGLSAEVVVVGAGPVGLSLALGLSRRGREVLVLEREPGTSQHSRAPVIWPGTQEVLARLGVIDDFLAAGIVMPRLELADVDLGGALLRAPIEELAGRTAYPHLLILPQAETERLLLEALRREPTARVRFSCEATGCAAGPDRVEVRFREAGADGVVDAAVVAGCDGAHSTIRPTIGAHLVGVTYAMRAGLADVRLAPGATIHSPRITTRPGIAVGIRIGDDRWRIILPFRDRDGPDLGVRVAIAAGRLFPGRSWRPVWRSEFRLHRRMCTSFARERVVLAGDAAHLNSPVGGQGMNAGIQDTVQLTEAIVRTLEEGDPDPLAAYGRVRRAQIRVGVNRFTDLLTRTLLVGRGRMLRPAFLFARSAMRIPPLRRRILMRIAMLEPDSGR